MTNILEISARPFVDFANLVSDFPIPVALFSSFLAGLATQNFIFGFKFFAGSLIFLAAVYVVTLGKAFGKGGHTKLIIRS